ncbi:hypothetical protein EH223_01490 [candidate division KSB1 bacterium]|nr:hypothetical protein [candidate division KSB1 bacterium]RQW06872.1 MAG: hypothetical protein EH223_01490 [candidate division KSB1 bacterium]
MLQNIPIEKMTAMLASKFLRKFAARQNKKATTFNRLLLKFIVNYRWHGNVRELENFVERLVTLAAETKEEISHELLPFEFTEAFRALSAKSRRSKVEKSLKEEMAGYEKSILEQALEQHHWNQSKTERALRISERTLRYKMERLRLFKPGDPRL